MQQRKYSRPAQLRVDWYTEYERTLVALVPAMAGKVDWNTVAYLYNTGHKADAAAKARAACILAGNHGY